MNHRIQEEGIRMEEKNKLLNKYLKNQKTFEHKELMEEAGQDKAFLIRTMSCAEDFAAADSEVFRTW